MGISSSGLLACELPAWSLVKASITNRITHSLMSLDSWPENEETKSCVGFIVGRTIAVAIIRQIGAEQAAETPVPNHHNDEPSWSRTEQLTIP